MASPASAATTAAATLGTVHPEHIALCLLAGGLVAPPPPSEGWGYGFNGPSAQRLLALLLLEEVQDTSSPTLSTLHALLGRLQAQLGAAGTVLARAVLSRLQALESPDDMVDFAAGLWGFLAPPGTLPAEATGADSVAYITTTSPLGLFLRRVRLGLSTLSLQGLTALVEAVQLQVQQTVVLLQQQEQQQGQEPHSSRSAGRALKDPAVLDAHLNTLLAAVQGLGACLPAAAVEAAAAPLAQLQGCPTKLDYLRLATSLAHRDMIAALSALHKYFDSSGSSSGTGGALGAGGSWALPSLPGLSSSSSSLSGLLAGGSGAAGAGVRGKGQHQAALHNLAALQMTLGHPQEALAALQELLRLGQQQGDEWGLLHGLSSLCRVMSASEGLQHTSASQQRPAAGGGGGGGQGRGSGWGLLDLRRTEQQLQLQSLLQRCLDSSRDMRAPHIAAFAAVALCRFRLQHAAAASSSDGAAATVPGFDEGGGTSAAGGAAAPTPAAASLSMQRMLLDVATLEHQAAIAAAAPSTPAVVAAAAAAAAAGGAAGQGPSAAGLAARSSDLYNPTEAFGTGTSSAAPGSVAAAGPVNTKAHTSGAGWRVASAAVSQALAAGSIAAAAALQLQGATTLAGVRCLMLLTGPGGAGVDGAACNAAVAAAAAFLCSDDFADPQAPAAAAAQASKPRDAAAAAAAFTGSSTRCEDVITGWVQLVLLVQELQGVAAAQHVLALAEGHFPLEPPQQLLLARQVLAVKAAVQAGRMPDAWLACEELQSLAPLLPQLGLELQLAAAEAHVQVLLAAGCCSEGHAAAAALFATAAGGGMQPQAVSALLLMARAALDAGDAAGSLGPALSALLHCQALQLDGLLPEAVLLVAAAWQELAPDGARFVAQLLQQVQPLAHASGKLRVWADVEHRLGVLQLAAAANGDAPAAGCRRAPPAEALQAVRQRVAAAAAAYEQAGDARAAADAWLLLAHVCSAAGQEEARNAAAGRWQQLQATTRS